jgi:hypothetical protein
MCKVQEWPVFQINSLIQPAPCYQGDGSQHCFSSLPLFLAGPLLPEQIMMVRTFTEHFGTTRRTRLFLTGDTLLMCYSFVAPGTDTESPLPHIVPAFFYHQLLLVFHKNG